MEKEKIYKRLKDIRTDMDLSQQEMAKRLGVAKSTYAHWEEEVEAIPLARLNDFCNETGYTMDYIIGMENCKKKSSVQLKEISIQTIGKNMQEVREIEGLTQKQLAGIYGTTQSVVSSYERGHSKVKNEFIIYIVKKYNISMDFICGRSEMKKIPKDGKIKENI